MAVHTHALYQVRHENSFACKEAKPLRLKRVQEDYNLLISTLQMFNVLSYEVCPTYNHNNTTNDLVDDADFAYIDVMKNL